MTILEAVWFILLYAGGLGVVIGISILASGWGQNNWKPKPAKKLSKSLPIITKREDTNVAVVLKDDPIEVEWRQQQAAVRAQARLERLRGGGYSRWHRRPRTRVLLRKQFKDLVPEKKGEAWKK